MTTFLDLLEEVWAVTPQECEESDLADDITGDIAASIDNFHTRQLATLYRLKQKKFVYICEQMEPYEEGNLPAQLEVDFNTVNIELKVLWEMLAFDLEVQFGHLLTLSERAEDYSWDVRIGWILWKCPSDHESKRSRKVSEIKRRSMLI